MDKLVYKSKLTSKQKVIKFDYHNFSFLLHGVFCSINVFFQAYQPCYNLLKSNNFFYSKNSFYFIQAVVFNGISISLSELKRAIMEKEGLKPTEVDLSVSNAQTSETYKNEQEMISKNSSVIVLRAPLSRKHQSNTNQGEGLYFF